MSLDLPVVQPEPQLKVPTSLVVRLGYMRNIAELPYDGDTRPGCGAKVLCRTPRGTELAEVLTTTCSNGGCAKSITRDKLSDYIANSGGDDYPFTTEGRIIRVATPDDHRRQGEIEKTRPEYVAACKTLIRELDLPMKLVEVELILGGEMATFYFMSEHRVDFRQLVKHLAGRFRTRIQMHQVGARDEARLVADYETCGQHCCCKQFLKVLKPISMGSAKMQKATLDPNKISGRCGRLKCCLRYEEENYEELRRKLPRIGTRVRSSEGVGVVLETMILTQLVKIRLESDRIVAVANEELLERDIKEGAAPAPRIDRPAIPSDREPREVREPRDSREPAGPRPTKDPRPPRESREPREPDSRRPANTNAGNAATQNQPRRPEPRPRPPRPAGQSPAPIVSTPPEIPAAPSDVPAMSEDAQAQHSKPLDPQVGSPSAPSQGTPSPNPSEPRPGNPGIGALGRVRRGRSRGRNP